MNLKLNLLLETIEINLHHLRTMETLYNNYRTFLKILESYLYVKHLYYPERKEQYKCLRNARTQRRLNYYFAVRL